MCDWLAHSTYCPILQSNCAFHGLQIRQKMKRLLYLYIKKGDVDIPQRGLSLSAGAFEVLQRLKVDHDLVVVTSRQHVIEHPTLQWLDRHFPDTFSEVHFGNHFAMEGASRKKSEICQAINAHILIDDNPSYAYDCASNGMHVLLFNWNLEYRWADLTPACASSLSLCHHNDASSASGMLMFAMNGSC